MIEVTFKPMRNWPHEETDEDARRDSPFNSTWTKTLALLSKELGYLDAAGLLIGIGLREQDIRLDGWPKAKAPQPMFPGVEISFKSDVNLSPLARRGRELIRRHGNAVTALKATHPDKGGNVEDFVAVQAAQDQRRMVYATDSCTYWQDNVRAIALGLEALRAVDRYGMTKRGQQYAGFTGYLTTGSAG